MLNSSHRAETNCYYLPSVCKFYKGRVQTHVAFPSISHAQTPPNPLAAARVPAWRRESFMVPRAQRFPTRRSHWCRGPWLHNFHYRLQQQSCLPQLHLRQQETASPSPQHWQRHRGSFSGDPQPPLTQALSAEAPHLRQAPAPRRKPKLELLLTVSVCTHEHV